MVAEPEARSRPQGGGRFGCLLGVAVVIPSFLVATDFLRSEMRYRSASEQIQEEVRQLSVDGRSEARETISTVIKKAGLPPGTESFELRPVAGVDRRFRLTVQYADTIQILNWHKIISRTIEAETS